MGVGVTTTSAARADLLRCRQLFSLVPMPPTRDDACTLLLLRHAHNSGAYFLIAAAFFPTL